MADMNYGFSLAQKLQQEITDAETWAANKELSPNVLKHLQAAHESLSRAFVAANFSEDQTATIFPGARKGAQPQDGGSGGNKKPPNG